MKYKPGDKFVITIGRALNGTREICYLVNNAFYLQEDTLDKLEPYKDQKQEAYQRGLADAWEVAEKVASLEGSVQVDLFGSYMDKQVFRDHTPQEVIAKLRAYEEAREIRVGDEVETVCEKFVVTVIGNDNYFGVEKGGALISASKDYCKKTGRSFPEVAALLDKMKDNDNV